MKVTSGVEQSIFVLIVLARQKNQEPIKSETLAKILGVSESYLRKIIRKLVVAGIIESNASRTGGIRLARTLDEVTFFDVMEAVEAGTTRYTSKLESRAIFNDEKDFLEKSRVASGIVHEAFEKFDEVLKRHTMKEVFDAGFLSQPDVDWNNLIS